MESTLKSALPRTLYKYCPPERIDIIEGLRIRYSPPSDFNDTFDTQFTAATSDGASPTEQAKLRIARARRRNQFGILCLTEKPNNHLMWVNYAQKHAGFVIGFTTDSPFFHAVGTRLLGVNYDPPSSDTPEENACLYKTEDWHYEEEWRHVRTFGETEDRLVEIPQNLISEIILGSKMEDGVIAKIALYTEEIAPKYFLSTPDHSHRRFVIRPKAVTPCKHCYGSGYRMDNL
jgi:hypothetical protein